MKTGIELITEERARQISEEGWTPKHDDQHDGGEMACAAACYAISASGGIERSGLWPWGRVWWKPKNQVRDLVRAGALIAAEIDRLQRAGITN